MESDFAGLILDEEEEAILRVQVDSDSVREEEALSLVRCFLTASIIHHPAMKRTMANLWHPVRGVQIRDLGEKRFKYERLTLFCFYCGRLGYSDSFCDAKIEACVEITEMGWDLSLRAQSRRAQAMNSVWLREEGGIVNRNSKSDDSKGNSGWGGVKRFECDKDIDPVLGFNLEGKRDPLQLEKDKILLDQIQMTMDHDLENEVVIGEEGKKRARGDFEENSNIGGRNRRMSEVTHLLSATAKRQAYQLQ
ncbi:hypothetical protein Goklo_016663 [Gossypium klotzschianum]|uniref:Zinc knuckle CX2CX4HX4C domain-containing protein n=1 Tax=Gossypium klotzschianum TaxID=34286 RepID=A0A7J8UF53_9ROSI|nr:hypothetical protein [Gossypium klotzschianum]